MTYPYVRDEIKSQKCNNNMGEQSNILAINLVRDMKDITRIKKEISRLVYLIML